jgi:GT2 family glycosyltransferase
LFSIRQDKPPVQTISPRLQPKVIGGLEERPVRPGEVRTPTVAALIVTWNRKEVVEVVLRALSRQAYPRSNLHVVVIDNGSTEGTVEHLAERWHPDAIYDNPTAAAHVPAFRARAGARRNGQAVHNAGGFASLTVIANAHNHGGCGGFNTGFAFVEQFIDAGERPLDYVWLLDDDVDLPENALEQLVDTGEGDPKIGLVGSRTMDFANRDTTIETTIYFDRENGWMGPDPAPTHPSAESHRRWVQQTGGTCGRLKFSGIREVDVVSASSLLARWSAVKQVGFWDYRYFIYCDDADWSLRFAKAGYKVVCDLDAVVYHMYWLAKLTPTRGYYAQRNLVWLIQKVFAGRTLRRATLKRLGALLLQGRKAMTHCRLFHAEIYRRTAEDIMRNRGGKLEDAEPPFIGLVEALDAAGALRPDARILVMCSHAESIGWADDVRSRLQHALVDEGRLGDQPEWVYMVRDGVPDLERGEGPLDEPGRPRRIVFEANRGSKWRAQKEFLREPPTVTLLFEQSNEMPMIRSRCNLHLDRRRPGMAQMEWDGWRPRMAYLARWAVTALRCAAYAARVRPYVSASKYG